MSIVINTNLSALIVRDALNYSTAMMDKCMLRLSTGSKINSAKEDPSGSYVAMRMNSKIRGIQVAYQNVAEANNLLSTAESSMTIVNDHLDRIKELAEEAASSSVSTQQRSAIIREVQSRVDEINRIASEAEFNDIKILDGSFTDPKIQVGANAGDASNSVTISGVFASLKTDQSGLQLFGGTFADVDAAFATASSAESFVDIVDDAIETLTNRISMSGIYQSRFESISDLLVSQNQNLVSAYSTVTDADIATETSEYVKYQILQQTASALLSQANQTSGAIALKLVSAL